MLFVLLPIWSTPSSTATTTAPKLIGARLTLAYFEYTLRERERGGACIECLLRREAPRRNSRPVRRGRPGAAQKTRIVGPVVLHIVECP